MAPTGLNPDTHAQLHIGTIRSKLQWQVTMNLMCWDLWWTSDEALVTENPTSRIGSKYSYNYWIINFFVVPSNCIDGIFGTLILYHHGFDNWMQNDNPIINK